MANQPTVVAPPNTITVAQQILATMAALSGVITDYNVGSQIRTQTESVGSVAEIQGISNLTLALQTITFSAMSLFGITPNAAVPATGFVTFTTALNNPPPATQNVSIPVGSLVQTIDGSQYATTQTATLLAGSTGVTIPVQAVQGGLLSNAPAGAIVQIITGLSYPLAVFNANAITGGLDAETPSQALTRLAAKTSSLVGGSPVSVANSVIGVSASGTTETVQWATCYEPWLAAPIGTPASQQAGFTVYIDNGAGTASAALVSAAIVKLSGNFLTNTPAYRPSGVPFQVIPDTPVFANVVVSGSVASFVDESTVVTNITNAITNYFGALNFGIIAEQGQVAAIGSNAALGLLTSFDLYLMNASDPTQTPVVNVVPQLYQRVILNNLIVNVT